MGGGGRLIPEGDRAAAASLVYILATKEPVSSNIEGKHQHTKLCYDLHMCTIVYTCKCAHMQTHTRAHTHTH